MSSLLDDLIEEFREKGRDDDAAELEGLRPGPLRERAKLLPGLEAEAERLRAETQRLERAPQIAAAFAAVGLDASRLSKLEAKAVAAYDGDLDDEAVGAFIEANELPLVP